MLQANLPEGWSYRRVGREARERGFAISDATATAYLGGRHGAPDDGTIEGFSVVLNIPLRKLRQVAGLVPEPGTPWVPPEESRHLDPEQRRALEHLVKVMARDRKAGEPGGDTAATSEAGRDPAEQNRVIGDEEVRSSVSVPRRAPSPATRSGRRG